MLPFVIALNGPPKIGKGWVCQQLMNLLPFHTKIMSFAEPLRQYCFDRVKWEDRTPEGYARFKEAIIPTGETGREFLIRIGNGMRTKDIHFWSRILTSHPSYSDCPGQIILIDDLGFPDEQTWLQNHSSGFATIVIAPTQYSIGQQWERDSRFCLSPISGFRTTTSTNAIEILKRRLENAQSYQTTRLDDRFNWFFTLMAGPVDESGISETVRFLLPDNARVPMVGEKHRESKAISSMEFDQSNVSDYIEPRISD